MNKLLFISSFCLLSCGSFMWGDANSSAPISVTIEKQGGGAMHEIAQPDQDAFITSQVRVALRNDPGFKEDKVVIKTEKGVVSLTGTVKDEMAKASLENNAKSVAGVTAVKNDLKIEK